ncbi:FAD-binding oxidoreductase, partial [Candidatus Saccharibacteria bacterium]|nr:FAD-binding oxidoreductase [Candidatus Saccharibacteria bacterium]
MSGRLDILLADKNFNGDIDVSDDARRLVSRDASIFEVEPRGVIAPRDTNDIASIVKWANAQVEAGHPVTLAPRVGGTCMSGGSLTEGYV